MKKLAICMLAVLLSLMMAIPIGGMMTVEASGSSSMVFANSANVNELERMGAEVVVNYHNGFYLMKVGGGVKEKILENGIKVTDASEMEEISLYPSGYAFHPRKSLPVIPSNLKHSYTSGEKGPYIVQFIGPIASPKWIKNIEKLGADRVRDIPRYAVLMRMTPKTAENVRKMPFVAWVGEYQPAYRIAHDLKTTAGRNLWLSISLFSAKDTKNMFELLRYKGYTVTGVSGNRITALIPVGAVPGIASMDSVDYIEKYVPPEPLDLSADKIADLRYVWYPSYTGLSTRFIGTNQTIGLQDTGFDEGDADAGPNDFFQGPGGDRIVAFRDEGGSSVPDGNVALNGVYIAHGTHCAGLISGNGWSWEHHYGLNTSDYLWEHAEPVGAAPNAKLSIDGCTYYNSQTGGSLNVNPKYWEDEANDSARIFSNSWGSGGDYSGTAQSADNYTDQNHDWLILFGAGNAGPEEGTLAAEACLKNGLAVGGSTSYRPYWMDADSPYAVWSSSSRGGPGEADGRLKPDMLAPATALITNTARGECSHGSGKDSWINGIDEYNTAAKAPGSDGYPDYLFGEGTSYSCPIVAGSAADIRQYLADEKGITDPNSDLIKALLINGARRLNSTIYQYPGYAQGWGLLDVRNSILPEPPVSIQWDEHTFNATGDWSPNTALDVASSDYPLKITLTWIDSPGNALNRDLDLEVKSPAGIVYRGNAYQNGWTQPNSTVADTIDKELGASWDKGDGYDGKNNVEQVEIEHPETGTWQVIVHGANIPSDTHCSLVVRGDIASKEPTYAPKIVAVSPPRVQLDIGGTATFPVDLVNVGTKEDTIKMSSEGDFTVNFRYGSDYKTSYALGAGEKTRIVTEISASSAQFPTSYILKLYATSTNDTSRRAYLDVVVDVIDQNTSVPQRVKVTDDSFEDTDPSVTAFTDSSGTPWVFVVYKKLTPTYGGGIYGGTILEVKYAQLNSNGMPGTWHGPIALTNLNEVPNDPRILVAKGGNYNDRVYVVWTGYDPNATNDIGKSMGSWGRIAWADNSDYSSWTCPATGTNTTIDENTGSGAYNNKRVNSLQYRPSSSELVYVYEHLDYDSSGAFTAVHDAYSSSTDGGATWSTPSDIDPGANDNNYYFFPNIMDGGLDYNNVVWMYNYHRPSTATSRNLTCMVYDGSWGADTGGASQETEVLVNLHNLQFPVVAYDKSSGSANDVFFAVLNDTSGSYQINVGYHSGTVSSSSPPADSNNAWGTVKGPFATAVSDANYDTRPIMNMISTPDDSGMWLQYIERATDFGYNIRAIYSSDNFNTVKYYNITSDFYGKGHQMSASAAINGTDYLYTTYYMTDEGFIDGRYGGYGANILQDRDPIVLNNCIYLSIYRAGAEKDEQGPKIIGEIATPGIYNESSANYEVNLSDSANPVLLTATVDDSDTGRSDISSACWMESNTSVEDPGVLNWSSANAMTLTGSTATEEASTYLPSDWKKGTTHRVWIRGEDADGNYGHSYIDIYVSDSNASSTTVTTWADPSWNLVSFPWLNAATPITDVLAGWNWTRAMVYNNSNKIWYTYNTLRDAKYNMGFPSIDNTMGIWIEVNGHSESSGTGSGTAHIHLYRGWNLVGYPTGVAHTVSEALSGIPWDNVQTYDNSTGEIIELSGSENMQPGVGYWIHVTSDAIWSVTWENP